MSAQDKIRVGVIGAGQLARMMVPPAIALGIDISVLAEAPEMSAKRAADRVGDYKDAETVLEFAKTVDVITFDHEHVPQSVLRALTDAGHSVQPPAEALRYAQNKILMRQKLTELGVPVPSWRVVKTAPELQDFIYEHGGRAVVKTATGGYDGKGVRVVTSGDEAADWFAQLGDTEALLAEELVDFTRELSQLVARNPSGQQATWPVVETEQRDGVCVVVTAPAPSGSAAGAAALNEAAANIGTQVAAGVGVTGVLAVEMFETRDGRLLVNELAMRPHNSGHFSIEGSITSQFEQHLRAVTDLPLGDTAMREPHAVMVNVLGGPPEGAMPVRYAEIMAKYPTVKIHSYGKSPRPGRKVGHVTVTGHNLQAVKQQAIDCAAEFGEGA